MRFFSRKHLIYRVNSILNPREITHLQSIRNKVKSSFLKSFDQSSIEIVTFLTSDWTAWYLEGKRKDVSLEDGVTKALKYSLWRNTAKGKQANVECGKYIQNSLYSAISGNKGS